MPLDGNARRKNGRPTAHCPWGEGAIFINNLCHNGNGAKKQDRIGRDRFINWRLERHNVLVPPFCHVAGMANDCREYMAIVSIFVANVLLR